MAWAVPSLCRLSWLLLFFTPLLIYCFFTPKVNKLPRDIEKKYEKCIKWSGNYSGCLSTKKNWCSKQRSVKTLHDNWNPLIRKLNFSDVAWKLWQTSPQTWHFLCILQYNWHCLGYVKHVMRMMMMLMLMSVCIGLMLLCPSHDRVEVIA